MTVAASEDVGWNSRPALRFHVAAVQEEVEGEADLLWEWLNQMVSVGVLEGLMSIVWEQAAVLDCWRMRELKSMTL